MPLKRDALTHLPLAKEGPLCVCHLQAVLDQSQVQISKTLATIKRYGAMLWATAP